MLSFRESLVRVQRGRTSHPCLSTYSIIGPGLQRTPPRDWWSCCREGSTTLCPRDSNSGSVHYSQTGCSPKKVSSSKSSILRTLWLLFVYIQQGRCRCVWRTMTCLRITLCTVFALRSQRMLWVLSTNGQLASSRSWITSTRERMEHDLLNKWRLTCLRLSSQRHIRSTLLVVCLLPNGLKEKSYLKVLPPMWEIWWMLVLFVT